ncbi:MAG: hypothetical protein ACO23R_18145 [bacterium]
MKSSVLQRIQEIYRTNYSGRKIQWDEPSENDTPEVRRHNAFLAQRLQRKQDSKERLKTKGAVPTKNGKPIFEDDLVVTEDLSRVLMGFRRLYQTNRSMRFREWVQVIAGMLDDLN